MHRPREPAQKNKANWRGQRRVGPGEGSLPRQRGWSKRTQFRRRRGRDVARPAGAIVRNKPNVVRGRVSGGQGAVTWPTGKARRRHHEPPCGAKRTQLGTRANWRVSTMRTRSCAESSASVASEKQSQFGGPRKVEAEANKVSDNHGRDGRGTHGRDAHAAHGQDARATDALCRYCERNPLCQTKPI
jgi:hypothetical protein